MRNHDDGFKTENRVALVICGTALLGLLGAGAAWAAPAAVASKDATVVGAFEGQAANSPKHGTFVRNTRPGTGWGWVATSDQRAGGHSTATIALVHPGAQDTHGALKVHGELKRGFMAPWAGALWFPGAEPMQPADLSAHHALVFWARGTPGQYSVMLMAGAARSVPIYAPITLTDQWQRFTLPLKTRFPTADLGKVYFVAFSAGAPGKYHFELDQVQLR